MTTDFRERIRNYQNSGDRLVIDEILYGATFDFMNDPTRQHMQIGDKLKVTIDLPRHEYYISYHIRALRDFALSKYRGERQNVETREFSRILSVLAIDYGIDFKGEILQHDEWQYYYRLTPELIENLRELMPRIESEVFGSDYYTFKIQFKKYETTILEQSAKLAEAERKVEVNILEALERALKYVDASRSEREIVKYVNTAFSTKFGELELARNGKRRIYRKDRYDTLRSMHVTLKFPTDLYRAILPQLTESNVHKLTKTQRVAVDKLYEVVKQDSAAGDFTQYSCTRSGSVVITRNYAAEKIDITYENLRKMLSRIKKRVTK
ncbi:hypothetical protein ACIQ7N_01370 [Lysinibacillus sp. NPDC095746]|uniref:hypothetical protein n=1 Tax=Lysinibacillus sp. NPDC095746 TaxID=3364134 RepID=UPI0038140FB4